MKNIKIKEAHNFIRKELPKKLQRDLRDLKMVREADLESSAYFHLRSYLKSDSNWRIFARKHTKTTGHYIDLLLFRKTTPRIAIELKWNRDSTNSKDEASLKKAIKKLNVNRSYFITTITSQEPSWKEQLPYKIPIEPRRILSIYIPLGIPQEKNEDWNKRRQLYT